MKSLRLQIIKNQMICYYHYQAFQNKKAQEQKLIKYKMILYNVYFLHIFRMYVVIKILEEVVLFMHKLMNHYFIIIKLFCKVYKNIQNF